MFFKSLNISISWVFINCCILVKFLVFNLSITCDGVVYVIYLLTNLTYHRTSSSNDISLLDLFHTLLWFLLFHIYMNILLLLDETFFFVFIVCFYFNIKVLSLLLFYWFSIGKYCVSFHCETYKTTFKILFCVGFTMILKKVSTKADITFIDTFVSYYIMK